MLHQHGDLLVFVSADQPCECGHALRSHGSRVDGAEAQDAVANTQRVQTPEPAYELDSPLNYLWAADRRRLAGCPCLGLCSLLCNLLCSYLGSQLGSQLEGSRFFCSELRTSPPCQGSYMSTALKPQAWLCQV